MNSTRCVLCAVLLSCLAFAGFGCKKEEARAEPSAAEEPSAPASAASPTPATPSPGDVVALGSDGKAKVLPGAGKVVADTPTYTVSLASPAKVGKGTQATVLIEIAPKEGWKLNKEFPTKLTVAEPAGVKVAKKDQTVADAVAFADKSGKWQIQFQADSPGGKDFTGVLKFAVCTDASCDPKKEQLAWNTTVE